ncbi:MAG: uracil-DNA glycosylase [Alphaproteobacteria bacterium]|nr:uracil-DNA glycosylase [Alphaproteobacteria bacterium]
MRGAQSATMRAMEEPAPDCALCPRLAAYRADNAAKQPTWFNAPVPSFGKSDARLLVVGLAPGVSGANRTGRPFTGDFAGDLLYGTLLKYGFARGTYLAKPDDTLTLVDCRITNAVRCVPPENKPTPEEATTCRVFLTATLEGMKNLKAIVALGRIAHDATLRAFGKKLAAHPFAHGAKHDLGRATLFDSFHCSRYNTNTRKLTAEMFEAVFAEAKQALR